MCLHSKGTIARDPERFTVPVAGSPAAFEASHLSVLPSLPLGSLTPTFITGLVCALSKVIGSIQESSNQPLVLGLSEFLLVCMKKKATERKKLLSFHPEDFCCSGPAHGTRKHVTQLALPTAAMGPSGKEFFPFLLILYWIHLFFRISSWFSIS